jgi:hypothetical protein
MTIVGTPSCDLKIWNFLNVLELVGRARNLSVADTCLECGQDIQDLRAVRQVLANGSERGTEPPTLP